MIPKTYAQAQSELEKRKMRREKRLEKRDSLFRGCGCVWAPKEDGKIIHEKSCRYSSKSLKNAPERTKKRKKAPSRSKLEKEAWDAFSLYIRERDRDKGCISCGRTEGIVAQAGHMIPRGCRATKYDETNVNMQCKDCNGMDKFKPGYHDHCVARFMSRYSPLIYKELVEKSERDKIVQQGKADMIAIRDTYREKLLTLKASRAQQAEDDRMGEYGLKTDLSGT